MNKTHGHAFTGARTPTYRSWAMMKQRCLDANWTNWRHYGGRGIGFCTRWWRFENFLADMGKRPRGKTLDRIDPDGNYELSNYRWATRKQQVANRRPYGRSRKKAVS